MPPNTHSDTFQHEMGNMVTEALISDSKDSPSETHNMHESVNINDPQCAPRSTTATGIREVIPRWAQNRSCVGVAVFACVTVGLLIFVNTLGTSTNTEVNVNVVTYNSFENVEQIPALPVGDVTPNSDLTTTTAENEPSTQEQLTEDAQPVVAQVLQHSYGEFRLNMVPQPNNQICDNPNLARPLCDAETGCSPTLFENALPHFHSMGGKEEDLGPAARQWLAALQAPASYLIRGSEPFAINFTVEQPVLGDGSEVVTFKIHETHTVAVKDNVKRRPVGGELGGSSYRAHVITRPVSDDIDFDTNVTELVTLCKIEDHFDGSYTVHCPVAASVAVLFRYGVKSIAVSANVHLDYTHFNGFKMHPTRSLDTFNPDPQVKTSKLYDFAVLADTPLGNIERPDNWNGDDVLRPCTQNEAYAAGDFGGTWIKWKGGQGTGPTQNLTYVPASVCSLTDWDTAGGNFVSKNQPLRSELEQCLRENDRSILLAGASHARFTFDEIADRIGVRNPNIELHHPDMIYFDQHLIHQHCTFFDVALGRIEHPLNEIKAGRIPRGFRTGDVFFFQTGAWNTAHCRSMDENLPRLDIVIEKLSELLSVTNATVVLSSSPPYSWYEFNHRWYRRNPTLQALAEIQKAFADKIGDRLKFLDFFTMALPKADLSVCINHYVCPRNSHPGMLDHNPYDVTMGVVGKRVTDALLTGVCGAP